jgi:hypothetical protein
MKRIGSWIYRVTRNITNDWSRTAEFLDNTPSDIICFNPLVVLSRESSFFVVRPTWLQFCEMKVFEATTDCEEDNLRDKECERLAEYCEKLLPGLWSYRPAFGRAFMASFS